MSKNWLKSKTIWGGLLVLGSVAAQAAGLDLPQEGVEAALEGLINVIGGALVIWGRFTADRPVHVKERKRG